MSTGSKKTKTAILKALFDIGGSVGAARIADKLQSSGINLQPRTVRFHLLQLDKEGLTEFVSKRSGRRLTERGRKELERANVFEKIGFIAAKVDSLGYRMGFNCRTGKGTIVLNTAIVRRRDLSRALSEIKLIFEKQLGMGNRIAMIDKSKGLAETEVPPGFVALCTVCSVTINGILLHESIPINSRFGGLLEMRDGKPVRFVELIEYSGATIDPLEVFIGAGMTSVRECARTGNGAIGASFREIPSVAVDDLKKLQKHLNKCGLKGILKIGAPNQPLFDIPVSEGRTGIIVVGGLNPFAAVREAGINLSLISLSALGNYKDFSTFSNLYRRYMDSLR